MKRMMMTQRGRYNTDGTTSQHAEMKGEKMAEKKIYKRSPIDLTQKNPGLKQIANCITTKDHGITNHEKEGNGVICCKQYSYK